MVMYPRTALKQPIREEELNCHGVRNSILMINSFQITVHIKNRREWIKIMRPSLSMAELLRY